MKNLKLVALVIILYFASNTMHSQVSISVNLGMQPSWGPVGYSSVNYYYLPDVQAYYDVRSTQFIYLNGGTWIRSSHLPRQYRNYDLNRGYKVVLNDYHGSRPYTNYRHDRVKYYKGYNRPQQTIGHRGENHGYNGPKNNGPKNNGPGGHDNRGGDKGHGNEGHGNEGHGHGKK